MMTDRQTKELRVTCTWTSTHTVEVPADYEPGSTLDEEWADQVDTRGAELVDWTFR